MINTITSSTVGYLLHQADMVRTLYRNHITLFQGNLSAQLEINPPKINRKIDTLSDVDALLFTRFTKPQLRLLMIHLWIPRGDLVLPSRNHFLMEPILIISMTKIATWECWCWMIRSKFGGNPYDWCNTFTWFVDHMFVTYYHNISRNSASQWNGYIDNF